MMDEKWRTLKNIEKIKHHQPKILYLKNMYLGIAISGHPTSFLQGLYSGLYN